MTRPRRVIRRSASSACSSCSRPISIAERARVGGIDEGEVLGRAQPVGSQSQQQRGEIGAQDFRLGERRAGLEVGFRIQPQA